MTTLLWWKLGIIAGFVLVIGVGATLLAIHLPLGRR